MSVALQQEQAVLGALLLGGDWYAAADFTYGDWTGANHADVYAAIAGCVEDQEPVDVVTVATRLERMGREWDGCLSYLFDLTGGALSPRSLETYARHMAGEIARRKARQALTVALNALSQDGDAMEAVARAQEALEATTRVREVTLSDAITAAQGAATQARDNAAKGGTAGAPVGLPFVDTRTGGFQPGRLWVVAGRPGAGKSAWCLQAGIHAAKRGHRVAMVSLEMGAAELATRVLAQHLGVSATLVTLGEKEAVTQVLHDPDIGRLRPLPFTVSTDLHHAGDLIAAMGKWSRQGVQVVIVDYLQRLAGGEGNTRNEQLGDITRRVKRAALSLGLCVVVVSSLNRGSEREARKPVLADLRESGDIEYDADVVVGLQRVGLEDAPVYDVELGLLKNRTGRLGWAKEPFRFDARTQKFMEQDGREIR